MLCKGKNYDRIRVKLKINEWGLNSQKMNPCKYSLTLKA